MNRNNFIGGKLPEIKTGHGKIAAGTNICFTGKGPLTRVVLARQVRKAGWFFSTRVNSAQLLVYTEDAKRGCTDKYRTADANRIPMMTFDDFMKCLK